MKAPAPSGFRARLQAREPMIGTFVKSTEPAPIEILGIAGFDFVVLDSEHAPFDRRALDIGVIASRAAGLHCVIRVRDDSPSEILGALDLGADGILVPHVSSASQATAVVAAARHSGGRGYSNSPRAGGYGALGMWEHVDRADLGTAVIVMIEDPAAVESAAEIMSVTGVDAVFVGRGDLSVALDDRSVSATAVEAATDRVLAASVRARTPVLLFVADAAEANSFRERGVTTTIIGSDQSFLRRAAATVVREARSG